MKILENRRFCSDSRGFTLIEVLVAMFILFILISPLLHLFYQGWFSAASSGEKTAALNLAQEKMEEIISEDYVEEGVIEGEETVGEYIREVEVEPDPENDSMLLVTVSVRYDVGEHEREVSVSTLLPGGS